MKFYRRSPGAKETTILNLRRGFVNIQRKLKPGQVILGSGGSRCSKQQQKHTREPKTKPPKIQIKIDYKILSADIQGALDIKLFQSSGKKQEKKARPRTGFLQVTGQPSSTQHLPTVFDYNLHRPHLA